MAQREKSLKERNVFDLKKHEKKKKGSRPSTATSRNSSPSPSPSISPSNSFDLVNQKSLNQTLRPKTSSGTSSSFLPKDLQKSYDKISDMNSFLAFYEKEKEFVEKEKKKKWNPSTNDNIFNSSHNFQFKNKHPVIVVNNTKRSLNSTYLKNEPTILDLQREEELREENLSSRGRSEDDEWKRIAPSVSASILATSPVAASSVFPNSEISSPYYTPLHSASPSPTFHSKKSILPPSSSPTVSSYNSPSIYYTSPPSTASTFSSTFSSTASPRINPTSSPNTPPQTPSCQKRGLKKLLNMRKSVSFNENGFNLIQKQDEENEKRPLSNREGRNDIEKNFEGKKENENLDNNKVDNVNNNFSLENIKYEKEKEEFLLKPFYYLYNNKKKIYFENIEEIYQEINLINSSNSSFFDNFLLQFKSKFNFTPHFRYLGRNTSIGIYENEDIKGLLDNTIKDYYIYKPPQPKKLIRNYNHDENENNKNIKNNTENDKKLSLLFFEIGYLLKNEDINSKQDMKSSSGLLLLLLNEEKFFNFISYKQFLSRNNKFMQNQNDKLIFKEFSYYYLPTNDLISLSHSFLPSYHLKFSSLNFLSELSMFSYPYHTPLQQISSSSYNSSFNSASSTSNSSQSPSPLSSFSSISSITSSALASANIMRRATLLRVNRERDEKAREIKKKIGYKIDREDNGYLFIDKEMKTPIIYPSLLDLIEGDRESYDSLSSFISSIARIEKEMKDESDDDSTVNDDLELENEKEKVEKNNSTNIENEFASFFSSSYDLFSYNIKFPLV